MMSDRTRVAIKVLITLALLGFLRYQIDLGVLADILLSASPLLILLGVLIQFTSMFVGVLRWQTILRDFDIYTRL